MDLREYLRKRGRGSVIELMRASGVMRWQTIDKARRGTLRDVEVAKRLAAATGGKVSAASMLGLDK